MDETAVITGKTFAAFPENRVEWLVIVESSSTGNGVIQSRSGWGDIRSEFRANYPGEVSILVYAVDDRGVPAVPQRLTVSVLR
jgi:hypothetical protein